MSYAYVRLMSKREYKTAWIEDVLVIQYFVQRYENPFVQYFGLDYIPCCLSFRLKCTRAHAIGSEMLSSQQNMFIYCDLCPFVSSLQFQMDNI